MIALAAAVVLAAVPGIPAPAPAQQQPSRYPARPRQVYQVYPAVDVPVTIAAGSVALVRVFWKDTLARMTCPCDGAGVNRLDRAAIGNDSHAASTAADITVYGTMAALPLLDVLDVGVTRTLAEDLVVYIQTLAIDTALQNAVNFAVARPRPATYAGDPELLGSGEGYLSFYAGHVATAFAALSTASFTLRRRHGARTWPWIVTGLVGGSVAVERVASGHHFPTDVVVAALAGTAVGITVPWLHTRPRVGGLSLVPAPSGNGLALAGTF